MNTYSRQDLLEINSTAEAFRKRSRFLLPCLFHGNKVANRNLESKIENWSTITLCFQLLSGRWIYLIHAYPLSIIHRVFDALAKWATEKYCAKVFSPKKWKQAFISDSFIPIIPVSFDDVVAMS